MEIVFPIFFLETVGIGEKNGLNSSQQRHSAKRGGMQFHTTLKKMKEATMADI